MVISQANKHNDGTDIKYVFITYPSNEDKGKSIDATGWRSPDRRTKSMYMSFHLEIIHE